MGLFDPQDINCSVAALDLAIAVIGAEPLVEQFDDVYLMFFEAKPARHLPPTVLPCLDRESHPGLSSSTHGLPLIAWRVYLAAVKPVANLHHVQLGREACLFQLPVS